VTTATKTRRPAARARAMGARSAARQSSGRDREVAHLLADGSRLLPELLPARSRHGFASLWRVQTPHETRQTPRRPPEPSSCRAAMSAGGRLLRLLDVPQHGSLQCGQQAGAKRRRPDIEPDPRCKHIQPADDRWESRRGVAHSKQRDAELRLGPRLAVPPPRRRLPSRPRRSSPRRGTPPSPRAADPAS
jgi:hypothetical protein